MKDICAGSLRGFPKKTCGFPRKLPICSNALLKKYASPSPLARVHINTCQGISIFGIS